MSNTHLSKGLDVGDNPVALHSAFGGRGHMLVAHKVRCRQRFGNFVEGSKPLSEFPSCRTAPAIDSGLLGRTLLLGSEIHGPMDKPLQALLDPKVGMDFTPAWAKKHEITLQIGSSQIRGRTRLLSAGASIKMQYTYIYIYICIFTRSAKCVERYTEAAR